MPVWLSIKPSNLTDLKQLFLLYPVTLWVRNLGRAWLGESSVPCGIDRGIQLVDGLVWMIQEDLLPCLVL